MHAKEKISWKGLYWLQASSELFFAYLILPLISMFIACHQSNVPICFIGHLMTMYKDTNHPFKLCRIAAVSSKVPFFFNFFPHFVAMLLCRSWAIFFSKDVKVSAIVFSSFAKKKKTELTHPTPPVVSIAVPFSGHSMFYWCYFIGY